MITTKEGCTTAMKCMSERSRALQMPVTAENHRDGILGSKSMQHDATILKPQGITDQEAGISTMECGTVKMVKTPMRHPNTGIRIVVTTLARTYN